MLNRTASLRVIGVRHTDPNPQPRAGEQWCSSIYPHSPVAQARGAPHAPTHPRCGGLACCTGCTPAWHPPNSRPQQQETPLPAFWCATCQRKTSSSAQATPAAEGEEEQGATYRDVHSQHEFLLAGAFLAAGGIFLLVHGSASHPCTPAWCWAMDLELEGEAPLPPHPTVPPAAVTPRLLFLFFFFLNGLRKLGLGGRMGEAEERGGVSPAPAFNPRSEVSGGTFSRV